MNPSEEQLAPIGLLYLVCKLLPSSSDDYRGEKEPTKGHEQQAPGNLSVKEKNIYHRQIKWSARERERKT